MAYVTWNELLNYSLLLVSVISVIWAIAKDVHKKK